MLFWALLLQLPRPETSQATTAAQARVNDLVRTCHARKVVELVALNGKQIAVTPRPFGKVRPSKAADEKFACVFRGMSVMSDLSFGFIGNEANSPSEKKQ